MIISHRSMDRRLIDLFYLNRGKRQNQRDRETSWGPYSKDLHHNRPERRLRHNIRKRRMYEAEYMGLGW